MRSAKRSRAIYVLPNLFTTASLFSGFYAIIAASNQQFTSACIAVFVAAAMDGLDGRVARLTGTSSAFGVQYDSLADLVSFGMAPALTMYYWALSTLKEDGGMAGRLGWAAAFLYAACAALRLARFNAQVGVVDKRYFIGLSSPAAAGLMMSFIWSFTDDRWSFQGAQLRYIALAFTFASAILMVSPIVYSSFKTARIGTSTDRRVLVLMPILLMVLVIDLPRSLFFITSLYALSGPLIWLVRRIRKTVEK